MPRPSEWVKKINLQVDRLRVDTAWTLRTEAAGMGREQFKKLGWDGKKPLLGLAMQNFFWWPIIPDFVRWIKGVKEYNYRMIYYYDYDDKDKQDYEKWKQTMAQVLDWAAEKHQRPAGAGGDGSAGP